MGRITAAMKSEAKSVSYIGVKTMRLFCIFT
jgi:hypothetical protein